ncbi:rhomboid family intramembrane serine protease [Geoalkalibacter sp.]|uniref:rhomboid family intramembrane serine protease n=1 Tax=Geoalkalibacter sp. TaxID=3041440 RepID=UPI00272EAE17|nr:rhomboid family intramembrane serine protease [Geoalkalibacter sp.]
MATDFDTGENWCSLLPAGVRTEIGAPLGAARARTWSLVLEARGIPNRLVRQAQGWTLVVPGAQCRRAATEIRLYEEKNRGWPPRYPHRKAGDNALPALSLLLLVGIFHNLTLLEPGLFSLHPHQWLEQGAAHAGAIRDGQWWRILTALTLHSNWLHLASNLAIGAPFVLRLCALLGLGRGWLLILASGALGNLLNALMQAAAHRAAGSSTALFGTLGILCALEVRRHSGRRRLLPLAAGAALLAMLGSAGENTDLGAHLFGLLVGIALGLLIPPQPAGSHPAKPGFGFLSGAAAGLLLILAWTLALRPLFQ